MQTTQSKPLLGGRDYKILEEREDAISSGRDSSRFSRARSRA